MVLEIRLQQRRRAGDPFLRAHLPVDQGRERTGVTRDLVPEAGALQHGRGLPPVGAGERAGEQFGPFVLVGANQTGGGVALERQPADARCDIRCDGITPSTAVPSGLGGIVLGEPLGIEDSIAQAEQRRHEPRESLARDRRVIAQPPPAHALGQHVARVGAPAVMIELHFVDALEPRVDFLFRTLLQAQVHPLRRWAGQHSNPRILPPLEILRQAGFDRLRLEQPVFVPLLGGEGQDANPGKERGLRACRPIAPGGVNREQADHFAGGEPGLADDVDASGQGDPYVGGLVHDHGEGPPLGAARQRFAFPPAQARERPNGHTLQISVTLDGEPGAEQRGKV